VEVVPDASYGRRLLGWVTGKRHFDGHQGRLLASQHAGESGAVLSYLYAPVWLNGYLAAKPWHLIRIEVDGSKIGLAGTGLPVCTWLPLEPGDHQIAVTSMVTELPLSDALFAVKTGSPTLVEIAPSRRCGLLP
jgi:hypothetical protein